MCLRAMARLDTMVSLMDVVAHLDAKAVHLEGAIADLRWERALLDYLSSPAAEF